VRVQYALSGVLLALTTALILENTGGFSPVVAWLVAINVFTLIFYRVDKLNSIWEDGNATRKAKMTRIPETSLLFLALVGGSPAAVLGMVIPPNHKTSDSWFLFCFMVVLVVQAIAAYLFWDQIPWT
jgi:uncharacterized membrane protein YsdA (DUF1294 family)